MTSATLTIGDDTITGLDPVNGANTAEPMLNSLTAPDGYTIRIVTSDGEAVTGLVGTGQMVQVLSGEAVVKTYTVILFGDANGDGRLNSSDLYEIFQQILSRINMTSIFKTAADADKNGKIDSSDLYAVFKHILQREMIIQ